MLDPSYGPLLDALRGVRWPARRAAPGGATGAHASRQRGVSAEFTEYRPYRQGDDPRRLDWKLLARSDRAYVRLATERTVLRTAVVVDASASMAYPAGSHSLRSVQASGKWAQARRLAVGLASAAHAAGDPVGLVVAGDPPRVLAPRTRRGVVGEVARTLDDAAPGGRAPVAPTLAAARWASRIALITDFLGDADALLAAARAAAAAGVDVTALHVVARLELEPPAGAFVAADPEDPRMRRPLVAGAREAYRRAFDGWRAELARAWRAAGVRYVEVADDEPAERAVRRAVSLGGADA
jgi:uncharacterized protein (DUF58 family)